MAQQSTSDIAYSRESEIINHFRTIASKQNRSVEETSEALNDLTQHYERLLDDSKLLTSVGDRLQKKLKSANLMLREQADEIKRANLAIQEKNVALQESLDALTRAKASRRATALLVIVALVLFLAAEIPESSIEQALSQYGFLGAVAVWSLKVVITLTLLPVQTGLERFILNQETRRAERDRAAAAANAPPVVEKPAEVERPNRPGRPPRPTPSPTPPAEVEKTPAAQPTVDAAS